MTLRFPQYDGLNVVEWVDVGSDDVPVWVVNGKWDSSMDGTITRFLGTSIVVVPAPWGLGVFVCLLVPIRSRAAIL